MQQNLLFRTRLFSIDWTQWYNYKPFINGVCNCVQVGWIHFQVLSGIS